MMKSQGPARPALVLAVGLLALAVGGCGGPATGDVSGRVSYKGKPLAFGSVVFFVEQRPPVVAVIGLDGRYAARGVLAGPVRVTVHSVNPVAEVADVRARLAAKGEDPNTVEGPAFSPADLKKWFPIPDRYSDPDKADLGYTVSAGPNEIDIELK